MKQLDRNFRWFEVTLKGPDMLPKQYIFRGLSNGEYRAATTKSSPIAGEEYILNQCVLDYAGDNELEGTSKVLLEEIRRVSGLDGSYQTLREAEEWLLDEDGRYEAVAVAMLAGITPTYMRNCDPSDRVKCMILGKFMFENTTGKTVDEAFAVEGPPTNIDEGMSAPMEPIPWG
jgi:hypothetical protein